MSEDTRIYPRAEIRAWEAANTAPPPAVDPKLARYWEARRKETARVAKIAAAARAKRGAAA